MGLADSMGPVPGRLTDQSSVAEQLWQNSFQPTVYEWMHGNSARLLHTGHHGETYWLASALVT